MQFDLQPYLENDLLILRPLKKEDFEPLFYVASDPLIWEQHSAKNRWQRNVFEQFFVEALLSNSAFTVIEKKTNIIIGGTRFNQVKEIQNAIEIGWTFLARQYWGGVHNKAMKQLMIEYAMNYVENVLFYVNENNIRSQMAIEKIGGKRITELEGRRLEVKSSSTFIYSITKRNP